jgi:RNA polymerase sigma-32 factor
MDFSSSRIVRTARGAAMLTRQEEKDNARRWRDRGDAAAREALFRSHLRLVVAEAAKRKALSARFEDLLSEGAIGLLDAIDRYDPECGARLATYAPVWIRAGMNEYVRRSTGVVCLPASRDFKRASSRIEAALRAVGADDAVPSGRQVGLAADMIDVPQHVAEAVLSRNRGQISLDAPMGDGEGSSLVDVLESDRQSAAADLDDARRAEWSTSLVSRCLSRLGERERAIYEARELSVRQASLDDLAARYGVSRQRINQIQLAARARIAGMARMHQDVAKAHLSGR